MLISRSKMLFNNTFFFNKKKIERIGKFFKNLFTEKFQTLVFLLIFEKMFYITEINKFVLFNER